MSEISKLAVIDPSVQIGTDVKIGPFCVIGPDVQIGDGCELTNNVTIQGIVQIGKNNVFYQNVVIGVAPQDLKYDGAPTETIIGNGNVFRESCTVHRGTELGGGATIIGNNNLFMVGVHIAHDCVIHDKVLIGNQTQLAGHVTIETGAVVSALIGLHHFVTVGKYSYIGGLTPVRRDVPPFMKFSGDPNSVRGVNEEGLKRGGFSTQDIAKIKAAHRQLFRKGSKSINIALKEMQQQNETNEHVIYLCDFVNKTCQSRFARSRETIRQDADYKRIGRKPFEMRKPQQEK